VAVVDGEPGAKIQSWRSENDPDQASRIPPHTTLCYWATGLDLPALELQVRHAFPERISVELGGIREFPGSEGAFYIELLRTAQLDAARSRLYDGRHLDLGQPGEWPWHITCVRYPGGRDLTCLREAAKSLSPGKEWEISQIACLELRGDRYEPVATWIVTR